MPAEELVQSVAEEAEVCKLCCSSFIHSFLCSGVI
jgi:hypothetical protein